MPPGEDAGAVNGTADRFVFFDDDDVEAALRAAEPRAGRRGPRQ